jgi:hypothetical protein
MKWGENKILERIWELERELTESRNFIAGHGYHCVCVACEYEIAKQLRLIKELRQLRQERDRR